MCLAIIFGRIASGLTPFPPFNSGANAAQISVVVVVVVVVIYCFTSLFDTNGQCSVSTDQALMLAMVALQQSAKEC